VGIGRLRLWAGSYTVTFALSAGEPMNGLALLLFVCVAYRLAEFGCIWM
jgi:hypothetical protein